MPTIDRPRGLLLAALGVLLFTPDAALFRYSGVDTWTLLFWRNLFTALAFLAWIGFTKPIGKWPVQFQFDRLGWLAACAFVVSDIGFMNAVLNAPAADALVVLSSTPLIAALVGLIGFGEKVPVRTWIAIAVALTGILITLHGTALTGGLFGCLMALVAALGFSVNLNCLRHSRKAPPLGVATIGSLFGLPISLAFVLALDGDLLLTTPQFAIVGLLGLLLHPASFGMLSIATRFLPSAEIALVTLAEVLIGPYWVWLLFSEVPKTSTVIGGSLILTTLLVHTLASIRAERSAAPSTASAPSQ